MFVEFGREVDERRDAWILLLEQSAANENALDHLDKRCFRRCFAQNMPRAAQHEDIWQKNERPSKSELTVLLMKDLNLSRESIVGSYEQKCHSHPNQGRPDESTW
jgi:hypothetical protein